jgi:hypothetical protein
MPSGFVYVLTNPAMPDLIKIGSTIHSPDQRAQSLSSASGVPLPFQVAMYAKFDDCIAVERWIHSRMSGFRLSGRREFFQDALHEAACWLYHHPTRRSFAAAPCTLKAIEQESFEDLLNPWRATM